MHLHHCRCFEEHLRLLLQSLRAPCLAPGGSGRIWKYLEALARSLGVSGRIVWCFRTKLHFGDVGFPSLSAEFYTEAAHECTQSQLYDVRCAWHVVLPGRPLVSSVPKSWLQLTCRQVIWGSITCRISKQMAVSKLKMIKNVLQMHG
jgi:hypothetical protein